jgi:integrase
VSIRQIGDAFHVYATKSPCTSKCDHKECLAGRRRKVYVGSFETEKKARAEERKYQVQQEMIEAGELAPEHDSTRLLSACADQWLAALERAKRRGHRAYSGFMKGMIRPRLGEVPITRLSRKDVERWRDGLLGRFSPESINSAITCLSSACGWFVTQGWISANPCRGIKRVEVPPRAYAWIKTRAEFERLLLTCSDELRDMIAVSVGTMMRIDELLHLHWDDVDLEARMITIQRGRKGPPKSGKARHVPILDSVLPVLQARALKRGGSVLVFPSPAGGVRTQAPLGTQLKGALRRAQMDTAIRWHDLRHTGASWWVMSGGDIFRLSKLMGHSDVKITQRTYAHLAPEAWQQDYHRLSFRVPSEPAKIVEMVRDEHGRMSGTRSVMVDARHVA